MTEKLQALLKKARGDPELAQKMKLATIESLNRHMLQRALAPSCEDGETMVVLPSGAGPYSIVHIPSKMKASEIETALVGALLVLIPDDETKPVIGQVTRVTIKRHSDTNCLRAMLEWTLKPHE